MPVVGEARPAFSALGIVGAGLMGASIAARAAGVWPQARLLVHDRDAGNAMAVAGAHPRGSVAERLTELRGCDLVFVCTPVSAIPSCVDALLADDPRTSKPVVVDTGSVKASVVQAVRPHPNFVPGHPLAGGHASGPAGANPDIIDGRVFVLTPTEATSDGAVAVARRALEELGARVLLTDPVAHDDMLALTSHLPHLIAYALVEEFAGRTSDGADSAPRGLIANSFRAQTIFAQGDPEMWADILIANREAIGKAAAAFSVRLAELAALSQGGDKKAIMDRIAAIRDRRKVIGD